MFQPDCETHLSGQTIQAISQRPQSKSCGPFWKDIVTLASPNLILKSDRITAMVPESARTEIRRSKHDTICRAQAGDENAFTEIYKEHRKRVFAICMKMVRDFSLAEDLTQDAFVQLHRNLASFRGDSAFTTWLHRLTVNVVLMYMRKRVLPVVS